MTKRKGTTHKNTTLRTKTSRRKVVHVNLTYGSGLGTFAPMEEEMKIDEHEGSKYVRKIVSAREDNASIYVDVYAVLEAFNVTCPARQQAIKKLLCAGIRGKGSDMDDLKRAEAAVARAIELQAIRSKIEPLEVIEVPHPDE